MPDFLFASDSLKGTLSSAQTAELLGAAARRHFPGCRTRAVPMADGGEGTAQALALAQGGRMVRAAAHDALGRPVAATYALLPHGRAVIEMAAAAGLPLVAPAERDVTIALGGSATNDGGMGCMRALGFRLLGAGREELAGRGGDLALVRAIDCSHADARLSRTSFTVMCDVDNPLLGPDGAARTFAPQKGADASCVRRLERGMENYARVLERTFGEGFDVPGAGAAGGMGAGCLAFLGAHAEPGVERVLSLVGFDRLLQDADLVVTGEGRLDAQTARGKVVAGVAAACARAGVPCVAVVGSVEPGATPPAGVTATFPTTSGPMTLDYALAHATELYAQTAEWLFSALAAGARLGAREPMPSTSAMAVPAPDPAPARRAVPPR
jgi:glycerate kinase